jgi:hypothetical protein
MESKDCRALLHAFAAPSLKLWSVSDKAAAWEPSGSHSFLLIHLPPSQPSPTGEGASIISPLGKMKGGEKIQKIYI